jgi:hypothetical protein
MKYSIVQIPKQPEFIIVDGPMGQVSRKNINPPCDRPATGVQCLYYDHSDFYGDELTKRVELWQDLNGTATDADIFSACPLIRDARAVLIRAEGNARLLQIANPYQPSERETWPIQMTEAEAWLKDNATVTPLIDAICLYRNCSKSELIGYIMENTNLFRAASGAILGVQQALLIQIYTATTIDALLSVTWP